MKNALIVLCHPNPSSFNHRLASVAKDTLEGIGYNCSILDIYQLDIPSPTSMDDFNHEFNVKDFDYKEEQKLAVKQESFHPEIKKSQDKISEADLLVFQFPLWWFSFPSALKNWIEKCFSFDFAYNGREKRWFDNGPLKGKKAVLSFTTSGPEWIYKDNGINGDISKILWPIHNGIFNFTGLSVLPPIISWASDTFNRDNKPLLESNLREQFSNIDNIRPLNFHPLKSFDDRYVLLENDDCMYDRSAI